MQVAIDGPAAAGKSTVAKLIANRLNYIYIDTGAMYRALTFKAHLNGVNVHDETALAKLLESSSILLQKDENTQRVWLDGEEVTDAIRNPDINRDVSFVAAHRLVREIMVDRQKKMAESHNVVMDGRDIGTHVLPNADVKIFLKASVKERAQRRYKEQLEKGIETPITELEEEIATRDKRDSEREIAPLVKAADAYELDTTAMTIEEVASKILGLIKGAKTHDAL